MDLSVHFISFQKLSSSSSSNKYASGITLSYNQKYIELYTKSIEDLNGFLYIFKKYAIQSNFEDMYSLDRRLGSGSYADVQTPSPYLFTNLSFFVGLPRQR